MSPKKDPGDMDTKEASFISSEDSFAHSRHFKVTEVVPYRLFRKEGVAAQSAADMTTKITLMTIKVMIKSLTRKMAGNFPEIKCTTSNRKVKQTNLSHCAAPTLQLNCQKYS